MLIISIPQNYCVPNKFFNLKLYNNNRIILLTDRLISSDEKPRGGSEVRMNN